MSEHLVVNRRAGRVDWDRCNLCGKRFSEWRELRAHKNSHTQDEIDVKTFRRTTHKIANAGRKAEEET